MASETGGGGGPSQPIREVSPGRLVTACSPRRRPRRSSGPSPSSSPSATCPCPRSGRHAARPPPAGGAVQSAGPGEVGTGRIDVMAVLVGQRAADLRRRQVRHEHDGVAARAPAVAGGRARPALGGDRGLGHDRHGDGADLLPVQEAVEDGRVAGDVRPLGLDVEVDRPARRVVGDLRDRRSGRRGGQDHRRRADRERASSRHGGHPCAPGRRGSERFVSDWDEVRKPAVAASRDAGGSPRRSR